MKNSIICDWLQLHVEVPYINFHQAVKSDLFDIELQSHGTQQFKSLYKLYDKETKEEVLVLAAFPRSEAMMRKNSGILKIVNKYLYQKNLKKWVQHILVNLSLNFVNITRIDVTLDFLKFDTMKCLDFINGLAERRYLKNIKTDARLFLETWSVDHGKETGGYESVKFGKESSDVSYQLYNKSLHMTKVNKPWILDNWIANGYDGKSTVWRLEFVMHSTTKGIVLDDGEILQFNSLNLLDKLPELFEHSFNRYFVFCNKEYTKKGNIKKQSRSEKLLLFENFKMAPVTIKLSDKKDSGRSAKILAKNLMKLNQELRGVDFDLSIYGNDLCTWIIKTRNIETWAEKKLPEFTVSDRVVDMVLKGRQSALDIECMEARKLPVIFDNNGISITKKPAFGQQIITAGHPNYEPAPF